jgi:hypothetical protein
MELIRRFGEAGVDSDGLFRAHCMLWQRILATQMTYVPESTPPLPATPVPQYCSCAPGMGTQPVRLLVATLRGVLVPRPA